MSVPALALDAETDAALSAWVEAEESAHCPPLDRTDLRKGIQALSELYVLRRSGGRLSQRAAEGPAKRAAFAVFFAPLHFLAAWAATAGLPEGDRLAGTTVLDLGCGTGAVGAAVARRGGAERVVGLDRTAWSLGAAQRTWRHLGVSGSARRGSLPRALGWPKRGEVLVFGWSLNELTDRDRDDTLRRVQSSLRKGGGLLVLEPLSRRITPWWGDVARGLRGEGVTEHQAKVSVDLPPLLRDLDRAAGLDHRIVGARVLWRPPA